MHIDLYIALAGLIVGCAVGLTGMGGGALMTPVLVLIFGVQPLAAVSSDLVASLLMKPLGAAIHAGHRTIRWPLVRWLALGSVPGALLGVTFLKLLGRGATVQNVVQVALGSVLLLSVTALLAKWLFDRSRRDPEVAPAAGSQALPVRRLATAGLGLAVGFIVGITATGSGTLIVVALLFLYPRLRGSQLVGTDLTQAIPMVGAAALGHVLFGDFRLALTLSIVVGAVPGVVIGSIASARGTTGFIRAALSVVLLASGLKLVNVPVAVIGIAVAVAIVLIAGTFIIRRTAGRQATLELAEAS
ncbi:MAG: sulfite exporter TauE/SafE family protein [Candidatus Dormibacteraeota bacterium]|nr:sulfite exporter TauE/SafE family protein [Candidatus Dormibacteraeota bacterium]